MVSGVVKYIVYIGCMHVLYIVCMHVHVELQKCCGHVHVHVCRCKLQSEGSQEIQ